MARIATNHQLPARLGVPSAPSLMMHHGDDSIAPFLSRRPSRPHRTRVERAASGIRDQVEERAPVNVQKKNGRLGRAGEASPSRALSLPRGIRPMYFLYHRSPVRPPADGCGGHVCQVRCDDFLCSLLLTTGTISIMRRSLAIYRAPTAE